MLAIQGVDDPYGTMAQIDGIADALPGTSSTDAVRSIRGSMAQALTAAFTASPPA